MPRRVLLALLLLPATAFAQFGEKVEVRYIEVPVTVLRDNKPVRNLGKANFEVYDNGQRRAIESFEAIDFTAPELTKKVSPLNPASRRNFLLLFDLSFSSPVSLGRAQEAARNFVARSVGQRDLVGIATVDVDRGFRFLTSFTTDRNLLAAAIRDPRNFRALDPLQLAGTIASVMGDEGMAGDFGTREANARNPDPAAEMAADLRRAAQAADDHYRRARVQKQVDLLGSVARSMQKLAGRKHVVLLSEGFDPKLVQGRGAGETAEQQEENTAVSTGEVWKVDSDRRFGHSGTQRSIQIMAEEFRRADVVLHSVDIQGVRVQNDIRSGQKVNSNEGLFLVSGATGGTVFRNTNDIAADFDSLLSQHDVVYVLGFHAPAAKAGQFHQLKVKLANVPGGRVQHRGGYYSPGAESGIERSLTTAEIIINDIPENDLDVAALAAPFPAAGGAEAQVPVILEIGGADLVAAAAKDMATVDIFVYAFDEDGLVRDRLFQRVTLDTSKAGDKLRRGGVKFYGTLQLPAGRYALKSLVKVGESDRQTFRRIELEVPATGDVAMLQPLFFAEAGEWVMVKSESGGGSNPPYPFVLDGEPFIPAARATLHRGEPRRFTVWVWNAQPDELTWEIAPEAKLVSKTAAAGLTKFVFALENVPVGTTEVGVTMRRRGSTDARQARVPVRVQ